MSALRSGSKASLTQPGRKRGWAARSIAKQKSRRRSWYGRIAKRDYSAIYEVELMASTSRVWMIWFSGLCLIGTVVGHAFNLEVMQVAGNWFSGAVGVSIGWWLMLKRRARTLDREIPWTECGPWTDRTPRNGAQWS